MRRVQRKIIVYVSVVLLVFASMASAQTGLGSPYTWSDVPKEILPSAMFLWREGYPDLYMALRLGPVTCVSGLIVPCLLYVKIHNHWKNHGFNPRNYTAQEPASEKGGHSYLEHLVVGVVAR